MAGSETRVLEGVVVGAGERGSDAYAPYLLDHPEQGRIVAVAEIDPERRRRFAERFDVPVENCFADYRELFDRPRLADFAIVATPDALHVDPASRALERGYAVLLEKPMATTEEDCETLARLSEQTGLLLQICHVLRYSPLFLAVKQVVDSGELGEIITIQHSENVSFWHYAHSYCRGNWRNKEQSSPMILAKSCHDLDILYWLAGAPPRRLTSLERPTQLCEANAPEGAPERCIDGCPHAESCPYDAVAMYRDLTPLLLDVKKKSARNRDKDEDKDKDSESDDRTDELPRATGWTSWPISVMTADPSAAGVLHALRTSRYGRCVYRVGDNDQPASQNVDILFENGVNASFSMHSTSYREGRETRIDGTRGSLRAYFYTIEQSIEVHDHKSGRVRNVPIPPARGTHGGADPRLFAGFLAALRGEAAAATTARESLWSHRMAFAADRAAREGRVMSWEEGWETKGERR